MKEDIKAKLGSMLSGIDKDMIKKFLENGGAEKLNRALSDEDKKRMAEQVMKMDEKDIKKKLEGIDMKNIDIEGILKKMK